MSKSWSPHYAALLNKNLQPATTLQKALSFFRSEPVSPAEKKAVDLGCGTGIDSFALLEDGWTVTGIDKEIEAINLIERSLAVEHKPYFHGLVASFETMELSPALLINASFALPFLPPGKLEPAWNKIISALPAGGRFAGHFFGLNDSWHGHRDMSFLSREQISAMFASFNMEFFLEVDEDSQTITEKQKHWHVYHVVARKI